MLTVDPGSDPPIKLSLLIITCLVQEHREMLCDLESASWKLHGSADQPDANVLISPL